MGRKKEKRKRQANGRFRDGDDGKILSTRPPSVPHSQFLMNPCFLQVKRRLMLCGLTCRGRETLPSRVTPGYQGRLKYNNIELIVGNKKINNYYYYLGGDVM
jgi:hypothetical protein